MAAATRRAVLIGAVALAAVAGALFGQWSDDEDATSGRVGAPEPDGAVAVYQSTLAEVASRLADLRAAGLSDLRAATGQDAQVRALGTLAGAYDQAADALAGSVPPEALRAANDEATRALDEVARAYRRLSAAARRGDSDAYDRARRAVARAESACTERLTATLNLAEDGT